jgi:hypothetical protein
MNAALSSITLEYYFGLTEKYHLTISEGGLSQEMNFVMGNLKAFYEYLR